MGLPEQAGALAVLRNGRELRLCLIRKKGSEAWGIPKGIVEPGATLAETALAETWEEAGLKGQLIGEPIGTYEFKKRGNLLTVAIYVMEVLEQLEEWEEDWFRERNWVSFEEAASLLDDHPVRPLLDLARGVLADWQLNERHRE
jgi:8-oxo-dGTP pyrophosphatase MutT (NUDIX family)